MECVTFRVEKTNAQIITRSRSGGPQTLVNAKGGSAHNSSDQLVSGKATPEEIKEKMEQQLKLQRAAHQQRRALEHLKTPGNSASSVAQVLKVNTNSNQGV